jgi:hypothetical protein
MPTLGEFLRVAEAQGVIVGTSTSTATGPRGEMNFRYAQRTKGGPVVILPNDDNERLNPTVLSYLCRQLGVDPHDFGLDLGTLDS